MFRLNQSILALAVLFESAAAEAPERELGFWRRRKLDGACNKRGKALRGVLEKAADAPTTGFNAFSAEIEACEVDDDEAGYVPGMVQWKVKVTSEDTQCKAYNWHIHIDPIGPNNECGGAFTDLHYDGGLACGGKSEYKDTACLALNYASGYGDRCSAANKQKGCEYGDLNGKMGKIQINQVGQSQRFRDNHIERLDKYAGMSIVVHCCTDDAQTQCGDRVACTNLYNV